MKKESSGGSVGIGFWGLLQIAFIILKLCNVIKWSWVWVLAPIWIGVLLFAVVIIVFIMFLK